MNGTALGRIAEQLTGSRGAGAALLFHFGCDIANHREELEKSGIQILMIHSPFPGESHIDVEDAAVKIIEKAAASGNGEAALRGIFGEEALPLALHLYRIHSENPNCFTPERSHPMPQQNETALVFPLKHPITVGGQTVSELRLQRPKVKHLKATDGIEGDIKKVAALIGQMGGLDAATVDGIDAEDFAVIAEKVSGFFG